MPRYYNKTRGPLPLELPKSGSTVVPAKSYIDIPLGEVGCASVVRSVKKGYLVPPRNPYVPPAPPKVITSSLPVREVEPENLSVEIEDLSDDTGVN